MERSDTHEDPEHRKDEQDILGKMLNMISSLRDELSKLWTRNAVLEKELAVLKPCCPKKKVVPSPNEGDGVESVAIVEDVVMKEE